MSNERGRTNEARRNQSVGILIIAALVYIAFPADGSTDDGDRRKLNIINDKERERLLRPQPKGPLACPDTVKLSLNGYAANLTDVNFFQDWFGEPKNALFWHELTSTKTHHPTHEMKALQKAWGEEATIYDNGNRIVPVLDGFRKEHWVNFSYVFAAAARHFDLKLFVLAVDVTRQDLKRYHENLRSLDYNEERKLYNDVFCAIENLVLSEKTFYMISSAEILDHCMNTTAVACQRRIEREMQKPGHVGIKDFCGHMNRNDIVKHELHPEHWC